MQISAKPQPVVAVLGNRQTDNDHCFAAVPVAALKTVGPLATSDWRGFFMGMLRFTIREMVLLMALVGMGLGWWSHVRRLEDRQKSLERDLLMQADYVDQFVSVLKQLGCE